MSGDQPNPPPGYHPPPGYGQPWYPQQPYGYPQPTWTPTPTVPKHPSAVTALVLGIIGVSGVLLCGLGTVVAPFAWWVGHRALRDTDESEPGTFSGRGNAEAGRTLGIIGTVLLVLVVIFWVLIIGLVGWDGSSELTTD